MRKYALPIAMLAVFETVAVSLWLALSNIFYLFIFTYIGTSVALGILLVFAFKDNRAFCKYLCPITVFLKPMSYQAQERHRVYPLCLECVKNCPKKAP